MAGIFYAKVTIIKIKWLGISQNCGFLTTHLKQLNVAVSSQNVSSASTGILLLILPMGVKEETVI